MPPTPTLSTEVDTRTSRACGEPQHAAGNAKRRVEPTQGLSAPTSTVSS